MYRLNYYINRIRYYLHQYIRMRLLTKENDKVVCPICKWQGYYFHDFDFGGNAKVYKNSTCPNCFSHPRHRTFYYYLKEKLDRKKRYKVLHFAPEKYFTSLFKSYPLVDYLSVDIDEDKAMQVEDIRNLSFADDTFDIIFCSHVLEHVDDDQKAMQELLRVMKPTGFAIIDVPIDRSRAETFEDPTIVSPEDRIKAYWQSDHVRLYGRDFPDKLKDAGFSVHEDEYGKSLGMRAAKKNGLKLNPIFYCTK